MKKDVIKLIVLVLLLVCMLLSAKNAANFALADENEYSIIRKATNGENTLRKDVSP